MALTIASLNIPPATLVGNGVGYKIEFSTSAPNNTIVNENYIVSGPNNIIALPTNLTNRLVIPLKSTTNNGDPFIKISYPQPGSKKFYITFGIKDSSFIDGYKDISTQAELLAIKTVIGKWVQNFISPAPGTTLTRILNFSVIGIDTNNISATKNFSVTFQYTEPQLATN